MDTIVDEILIHEVFFDRVLVFDRCHMKDVIMNGCPGLNDSMYAGNIEI
jgi:hypothetical protein